jgi:hypothetical protein
MTGNLYSDRTGSTRARDREDIDEATWGGIVALITRKMKDGSFGNRFPDECPDRQGIAGTDENAIGLEIRSLIPSLEWPLQAGSPPGTLDVLDLIEFCHESVAKPIQTDFHSYWGHHHLRFVVTDGQTDFRQEVNRILRRNGVAFDIQQDGRIVRLPSGGLQTELLTVSFSTGDSDLDELLDASRRKFLDPNETVRREALEKLWDAWERLKTLEPGSDKKQQTAALLDRASVDPAFRQELETEARRLTDIGNNFMIRHTETTKTPIRDAQQVDYLFQRLFALIYLTLRKTGRIR